MATALVVVAVLFTMILPSTLKILCLAWATSNSTNILLTRRMALIES